MWLRPGRKVVTVFGWTPGLRQLLDSRVLPCGCLIGIYETQDRRLVEILDARCEVCEDSHNLNQVVRVRDAADGCGTACRPR